MHKKWYISENVDVNMKYAVFKIMLVINYTLNSFSYFRHMLSTFKGEFTEIF